MLAKFRHNFLEYLRANIVSYFFILLIFAVGVVMGALAVKTLPVEQKTELIGYLRIFFSGIGVEINNGHDMLFSVLLNHAKTVVIMWILGFTIVGIPFVLFILFTRGFIIGFTVGFLVNEYVMKGLLFALVAVLPHNFFAVPAVLVTAVAATHFSLLLVRKRTRNKVNLLYEAISYSSLCFFMLALMMIAGLVEVYISPIFMKVVASMFFK